MVLRSIAVLATILAAVAASGAPKGGGGAPEPPKGGGEGQPGAVAYKGKMVDEAGKPVSGIFPITFKIYSSETSKKPTWSETLWVAVDRGAYTVRLGDRKPLPSGERSRSYLGVDIRGIGEVVREPLATGRAPAAATGGGTGPAKHAGGTRYADTAGYAVESDHAKNADRIQNMTFEDLARRLAEEGGGPRPAAAGGGGVKIGTARRLGARIGGPGGTSEYNETCPKGYVMVGIKGGAGMYLDSVQIVCAPLE